MKTIEKIIEAINNFMWASECMDYNEFCAAEALLRIVTRQHDDFIRRNADEIRIEQLENKLLGYSR